MKLKNNSKRNYANMYRLNNMHLNDQWVTEEIRGVKKFPEANETKQNSSIPVPNDAAQGLGKTHKKCT
jgi:hypothetical protein